MLPYESQSLLDTGVVNSRADIARLRGISRARVTQLMNVPRLPKSVRACLTALTEHQQTLYTERRPREIMTVTGEDGHVRAFEELLPGTSGAAGA